MMLAAEECWCVFSREQAGDLLLLPLLLALLIVAGAITPSTLLVAGWAAPLVVKSMAEELHQ
jgi:hypothetical protein